ncbi:MAG TPA: hypothetical protein DD670_03720 [Planctomycetaceae bacterium]|nr:hypothetical protein [Planctomycetaceae bacterium]
MAYICYQAEQGQWIMTDLTENGCRLSETGISPSAAAQSPASADQSVSLVRLDAPEEAWILMASPPAKVSVNGSRLLLGIRVLDDRDEILRQRTRAGVATRFFFSAERRAEVKPFRAGGQPVRCPRCKQLIGENDLAVRCPNPACGLWHHETADLPCWTYDATCASPACIQSTELRDHHWTPEDL